jgi:hypothetical protein
MNRKDQRLHERQIIIIERAVDEDIYVVICWTQDLAQFKLLWAGFGHHFDC